MIYKNVANQKLPLYLVNSSGQPVTGEAANITAYISVDGGTPQQVSPVVEVGGGYYVITPSQSQTNGDLLLWWGTHATHICRGGEAFTSRDYTAARAQALDNLDASITSRLAASDYTPPDNAGITAIKSQTDKLRFTGPSGEELVLASASVDEEAIAQAVAQELQGNLVQVIVAPIVGSVQSVVQEGTTITAVTFRPLRAAWYVRDANLSSNQIRVVLFREPSDVVAVYSGSEIVVSQSGSGSLIRLTGSANKTPAAGQYAYALEDATTNTVLFCGKLIVKHIPLPE